MEGCQLLFQHHAKVAAIPQFNGGVRKREQAGEIMKSGIGENERSEFKCFIAVTMSGDTPLVDHKC